jgi:hypothetical protein
MIDSNNLSSLESVVDSSKVKGSKKARKTLNDFEFVTDAAKAPSVLGRGAFGEVKLVKELGTGTIYALKTVQKSIFSCCRELILCK